LVDFAKVLIFTLPNKNILIHFTTLNMMCQQHFFSKILDLREFFWKKTLFFSLNIV
jgi:hypothetical protein